MGNKNSSEGSGSSPPSPSPSPTSSRRSVDYSHTETTRTHRSTTNNSHNTTDDAVYESSDSSEYEDYDEDYDEHEHEGGEQEDEGEDGERKTSYIQQVRSGYNELVKAIIRPPRSTYTLQHLGPISFPFLQTKITRTDFSLSTSHGSTLQCSHWENSTRTTIATPCLIYMHGNSSTRLECLPCLSYILSMNISVFAFDFTGSGMSSGEYVTLGWNERDDLQCVIEHLRSTNVVTSILLYGRSMGAATAIMHVPRDPSIAGMICDSSFTDLTNLAEEMVAKARGMGVWAPSTIVSVAIRLIASSVKRQANFHIRDISPISHAPMCYVPCLFVAAEGDAFIPPGHSRKIHEVYGGDKNIVIVEGDHNSIRPVFMYDSICIFIKQCLNVNDNGSGNGSGKEGFEGMVVEPGTDLSLPPWMLPGRYSNNDNDNNNNTDSYPNPHNAPTGSRIYSSGGSGSRLIRETGNRSIGRGGGGLGSILNNTSSEDDDEDDDNEDYDDSGITCASSGIEGMGMTNERQEDIQNSLLKMMGSAGTAAAATTTIKAKVDKNKGRRGDDYEYDVSPSSNVASLLQQQQQQQQQQEKDEENERQDKAFFSSPSSTSTSTSSSANSKLSESELPPPPPPSSSSSSSSISSPNKTSTNNNTNNDDDNEIDTTFKSLLPPPPPSTSSSTSSSSSSTSSSTLQPSTKIDKNGSFEVTLIDSSSSTTSSTSSSSTTSSSYDSSKDLK